ncbi:MAG TPA: 50S ribosomal protein L22 [Candidatus Saccharimonadales bacterium]|nr:50S ribosomal protein L22 [Candidatus Saccharimonadales bacterium]
MKYSIQVPEEAKKSGEVALAQRYDMNVSYKDLGAVCEAVKYMQTTAAIHLLEKVMNMETAIEFRRHNKHMGSRHELGGRKGKYPRKASNEVRLAILNAMANATNNGNLDAEKMYIIHATSNKTHIERRSPSKGSIAWGRGMYGRSAINHSDIEYSKVEIGIANGDYEGLTQKMKYFIGIKNKGTKAPVPALKTGKKPAKEKKAESPAPVAKPKAIATEVAK